MKAIKRTLTILMCLCMVFGCASMIAFAEEPVVGSITIQNPSHSDATVGGKTFNVYKVFDATTSGTNTSYSWYTDENGNIPFYDFFYGANGVVEANKANGNVQEAVDYVTNIQKNEGNLALSQLAEALYAYIAEANKTTVTIPTIVDPITVGANETSVKIDNLEYGYYLVYDNSELSESSVRSAVMLTTVNKDAVVTLKANRPEISKTVLENDGNTYGKGTSAMIGEDVTFKIETLVPSHTLYNTYKYYINDTLPEGITLNDGTIKAYLNETTELTEGTDYTLSVPGDNGASFKVDFSARMVGDDQYEIGDKLSIVYSAHVTNGIKAQEANVNTALLSYNNDPTNDTSVGSTSSTANVYSYQFVFTKFAEDTSGVFKNVRLIGAEFQLYKVEEDGTKTLMNFTTADAVNAAGVAFTKYIVAEEAVEGTTVDTLKNHETGDETVTLDHLNYGGHRGDVFIFGLSEGKYELVETKAPDGYILPDAPFVIEIQDAIGELGSVGTLSVTSSHTGSGSIVNTNGMGEQILTVWADITNEPGSALPETGGMGTTIFTVAGIIMMAGAIAFFTSRKRSSVA